MKKLLFFASLIIIVATIVSCSKSETYADKRNKEKNAISRFISDSSITVISEAQFSSQGDSTSVKDNEYVLFESSGVYMQIISKGCGSKIKSGEYGLIITRFKEYNILGDSLQLQNWSIALQRYPEHMYVMNSSGTFTGIFNSSNSLMYYAYGSTAVPEGWLIPLRYVNIGRPKTADESIAHVKLIVPGAQGQAYASSNVYPCYYELTFQDER